MEIGASIPPMELHRALQRQQRVAYRQNGPRIFAPKKTLKNILPLVSQIGLTRIAEISQLSPFAFPVFQSTRPNLYAHTETGQNSGSQGKGFTREQALVSCIMESVEAYCAEPRGIRLIRGEYSYLRNQHVIARPSAFARVQGASSVRDNEPLMWTPILALGKGIEALIPAETVYFPFFPNDYETRSVFPQSGNGVAAGNTYLEAVIHALYEEIERYLTFLWETGQAKAEALYEDEVRHPHIKTFQQALGGEFELQLYSISSKKLRNLAMIMCLLVGDTQTFAGYGCSANLNIAIERAGAEAFQSMTTIFSASRESLVYDAAFIRSKTKHTRQHLPEQRTLHVNGLQKRLGNIRFRHLNNELDFLLNWIHKAGFSNVFVANLSRRGLEIPVVKTIIPGMPVILEAQGSASQWSSQRVHRKQYAIS